MRRSISSPVVVGLIVLVGVCALTVVAVPGAASVSPPADGYADANALQDTNATSEEEYVQTVPEEGDPYFEAAAEDGSWVSYVNPRDEYRSPYLGDGSGKICVSLRNENGEVIVGESVPNTRVTIPTGETISWHTSADPMTVRFPLTRHYDRPLDADQFGTSQDLPQGDGYLDSHCIEFHGPPEDATIEYGEAEIHGKHADRIEVVGYVQQEHEAWDTSVDPIDDAESYERAGGGWTYREGASHGQVVVVLQLESQEDANTDGDRVEHESARLEEMLDEPDVATSHADADDDSGVTSDEGGDASDEDADASDDSDQADPGGDREIPDMPGFGVVAAVVALSLAAVARARG